MRNFCEFSATDVDRVPPEGIHSQLGMSIDAHRNIKCIHIYTPKRHVREWHAMWQQIETENFDIKSYAVASYLICNVIIAVAVVRMLHISLLQLVVVLLLLLLVLMAR